MKVSELIEILKELPQDHEVIMSKDAEGNNFSPYSDYGIFQYEPETTWYGNITSEEDAKESDSDYKENAVVLWPVN